MSTLFKNRPVVAYYPMWHENQNWGDPKQSRLAQVTPAVNVLILSFIDPAKQYSGLLDSLISEYFFEGEGKGLQDTATLINLKQAIVESRQNCRGRKILVSAGGEIGGEFINADFESMALLVADLGLDGLDLDYEPAGGMTQTAEQISIYKKIISDARISLDQQTIITGKKYLLSCAPTGVGLLSQTELQPELIENVSQRLSAYITIEDQLEALRIGETSDDPSAALNSALSSYNFESAGKMVDVFHAKSQIAHYAFIGNMVDIVIYQAYNMGSVNLLGRLLCYESHRAASDKLQKESGQRAFAIVHGSHIGQEAFPRYSHTLTRLQAIYAYICEYGRSDDGASFWAYGQDPIDKQDYLPAHGMGYHHADEVFEVIASLHNKYATVAPNS